jgi:arylamine N-acetyltransferase
LIPVDEVLEDLDLPRADPGAGYLERLFLRFNERVPFESASKIVRAGRVADRAGLPRLPEIFWAERLESGAGGTCFARVAAFDALISELGFSTRRALGRVREDFDHAALLVSTGDRDWICDVGFPLPVLLPAQAGRVESALGAVEVSANTRGLRIDLERGVPDGPRQIEIFSEDVAEDQYRDRWEATFRRDGKFLSEVVLQRLLDNRRLTFVRGSLRVEDRHSRTVVPLQAPRAAALEDLFGVDRSLLEEALEAVGDPDPVCPDAVIEVFLESPVSAGRALSAISPPGGYARLLAGVADVVTSPTGPGSWRMSLSPPGSSDASGAIEEEIAVAPDGGSLVVRRGARESAWSAEERDGSTWLVRRAKLDGPRLDLIRNDSLRGRLAGSLAVDLLAWARLLGRTGAVNRKP